MKRNRHKYLDEAGDDGSASGTGGEADGEGEGDAGGRDAAAAGDVDNQGDGDSEGAGGGDAENWRSDFSGGDEKRAKVMGRFSNKEAFGEAYFNQLTALSKRAVELPGEDATEEQWKEYRESNNIPQDGAYELALEFNEYEKPYIEAISKAAFDNNLPTSTVEAIATAMKSAQDMQSKAFLEMDAATEQQSQASLQKLWGQDYKANNKINEALMSKWPEEVRDAINQARGPDGVLLKNNAAFVATLNNVGRVMIPGGSIALDREESGKSIEDRLKEISDIRRNNESEYWGNPKLQKEELELFAAQDELKAENEG